MEKNDKEYIKTWVIQYKENNPNDNFQDICRAYQEDSYQERLPKEIKDYIRTTFNRIKAPLLNYSTRNTTLPNYTKALRLLIENKKLEVGEDKIVLLNNRNSEIIENAIAEDNDYIPFAKYIFKSFGKEKVKNNEEKALLTVVREIDRDNSTNVWRYNHKDSIINAVKFISETGTFFEDLEKGKVELPDKISNKVCNMKSLSSKICKYLSEYFFEKDNYYINDKYVRTVLPFYLDHYKVNLSLDIINNQNISSSCMKKLSYEKLHKILEALREKANLEENAKLTKSQLDHILWYCYKSYSAYY